jgi:2',3'-cyclic-nucleotide 2'-phosphodiesterase (5'-nucleotidase family)
MRVLRWSALTGSTAALLVVLASVASGSAGWHRPTVDRPTAKRVVFFTSDGMRPDLMEKYAADGGMPTYKQLLAEGVRGDNGALPTFPPNTGVGWYSLMTGSWAGEHGSTNNTFHRSGDAFANSTSFSAADVLQADTLAAAAERRGLRVAQVDWVGGKASAIAGPTVDFVNFFSGRGVYVAKADAKEQAGAASFGLTYQILTFSPASGWTNVPAGDPAAPPKQTQVTIGSTFAAQNPDRTFDVYVYDANVNGTAAYDHVLIVSGSAGKNGSTALVTLGIGDFKDVKLSGSLGLIGTRAGQTVHFYLKLAAMSSDLSTFKLYQTSLARAFASCATAACKALPSGGPGEDPLEKYIADNLPGYQAADFAPIEARIIDEETYVQQGRELEGAYGDAVLKYILGTLQPDTDVAFVGYPVTDEFSHQFMSLYTPTDMDGRANPYYDDVEGDGNKDARVAIREGYVKSVYGEADKKLALARKLMGGSPTTFASSDHGFAPQWLAINARKVLYDSTVKGVRLQDSGAGTASNCRGTATDLTKACWAGGTAQIYINPTLPAGIGYEDVQQAVINAFAKLGDPSVPGRTVIVRAMKKDELRNVDGVDALHPSRSGDVVVVSRPPYQFDAATPDKQIAFSQFFGQHGYLPDTVDLKHNIDMHSTFVAAGPGIGHTAAPVKGVRTIDLAPTIAFLLGIPGPQNARGKILYDIVPGASDYREVTILDISDYHGQLIPLTDLPDAVAAAANIGGSAYLKPWFDTYRKEARNGSITIAGGDSVGATPPISAFFGDTPTVEVMRMMGFNADGLGNHNFDKGQEYLRKTLIPIATKTPAAGETSFVFLSANMVDATKGGKTPAEWAPYHVFRRGGVKIGLIGYSNEDIPELTSPKGLVPFAPSDAAKAVNATAAMLRKQGVRTIVAVGHLGATQGTLTSPTGPLVDLAVRVAPYVNTIVGDHTDFQVNTTGPHSSLITENRSKGLRFTRIRLVIDPKTGGLVYQTADWHKPWDIGVTPDPAIQTKIDELNTKLGPVLSKQIGISTVAIPRTDSCGNTAGRTCESKEGDLVTDALRSTYGVDFAITNSGGLRADLTCPTPDNPSDFCPAFTPPPYPITRGQVLGVLPFGNIVVVLKVTGAELKQMLENGVSTMPAVAGRFPEVSGLCFTYDITRPALSRVTSAVKANADGSCTSTPVDFSSGTTYSIAENDFMAAGGDGYPVFSARATSQGIMDQVVADYITAKGTVSPALQGRIACTGSGCPALTNP